MRINWNRLFRAVVYRCASLFKDDRKYLETLFPLRVGYHLNLDNPQTYCEKLQWLKLYDRRPEYTQMVDKVEAKKYVSEIIGEKYIIPTLAVYDRAEDIDFDALPSQFVLKCTHDSGGGVICKDKTLLDRKTTVKKLKKFLKKNYFCKNREWPYKNIKPRIIAEQYLTDGGGELNDYKFFCFAGVPKVMFIATERFNKNEETKFDFYDMNFNHLPFTNGHPNAYVRPKKPMRFEEMKSLAAKLSVNIPQIRVDFYEVNGNVYFGELTFFHWSGMKPFVPVEWDYKFGELIHLPE